MSRYYSKRNKAKVWRKTYGTPFARRRAFKLAQMSMIASQGVAQVNIISGSFGGAALKAVACADAIVNFSKAVSNIKLNDGLVIKEQSK